MNAHGVYLRPDALVEPLVDRWYGWSHLIPPATAARNLTERHLNIMNSYLEAPAIHAECVKNPQMSGGPFMDYVQDRSREIRDLRDQTVRDRAALITLSKDIAEMDALLRNEAKGFSLEPLYRRIPETLKGYVELVYDLNRQASFRLIEALLYNSPYYNPSAQSLMMSRIDRDDRPFALSTPRLDKDASVHFQVPFNDEVVDALFAMTRHPDHVSRIAEMAGLSEREREAFETYTTLEPPAPYSPYRGSGLRWRYFGHACILLEAPNFTALFDPVVSYTYRTELHRYTYEDLPERLDVVFITHNHQDHILFETLLRLRSRIGTIVVPRNGGGSLADPSLKLLLERCGFRNVTELGEMEEIEVEGGTVTGVPFLGEHADLDIRTKLAYLVRRNEHSLMFAADSRNLAPEMYAHIHRIIGDVDVLFLGMECDGAPLTWVYGPLLTSRLERAMDVSRRLAGSDYERAIAMVRQLGCRQVYVYAMGQEPWLNHIMCIKYGKQSRPIVESDRLVSECLARGIEAERLFGEKELCLSTRRPAIVGG
jgi:L-ascorbate metabolism protein UlaG (beta-lactamase superfamily)